MVKCLQVWGLVEQKLGVKQIPGRKEKKREKYLIWYDRMPTTVGTGDAEQAEASDGVRID